jgi:hypothetical protein
MGGAPQNPSLPQEADVWEVLDSILNNKPVQEKKPTPKAPAPPMGGGSPGMGGGPPMGMGSPAMGGGSPMGEPHLMQ